MGSRAPRATRVDVTSYVPRKEQRAVSAEPDGMYVSIVGNRVTFEPRLVQSTTATTTTTGTRQKTGALINTHSAEPKEKKQHELNTKTATTMCHITSQGENINIYSSSGCKGKTGTSQVKSKLTHLRRSRRGPRRPWTRWSNQRRSSPSALRRRTWQAYEPPAQTSPRPQAPPALQQRRSRRHFQGEGGTFKEHEMVQNKVLA